MRNIIKISLIVALLLGIVLMVVTFIQAYQGYKNINYRENIRKLLTGFSSKNKLRLDCYIETQTKSFEVENYIQFYLDDPDSVKEITFTIQPKNQIRVEKKLTYHPIIGIVYYFPRASDYKVFTLSELPLFNQICRKTEETKFKLEVVDVKKGVACDDPKNLTKDYNLKCIYWNGKTIMGHLGERISCNTKITNNTQGCITYIQIKSEEEVEKYRNDCKTRCFMIPEYYLCKITKKNYFYNAILKTLEFFSKWEPDVVIVKPDNTAIRLSTMEIKTNKKTLESVVANLPDAVSLDPITFTSLLNQIESYYQVNSMGDIKIYGNQKKIAFYFTTERIDQSICKGYKNHNISLIVVHVNSSEDNSNHFESLKDIIFEAGCHEVSLDFDDFYSIEKLLELFYDSTQNTLFSPYNFVLQINPQKPELVHAEKLTEPINTTIGITDDIRYLPITISLSGRIQVDMKIKREICKAKLLNETG